MADDEFIIGFSDSEWTGIAPILEEDVAISSLAQDELGHAQALYRLLAELRVAGCSRPSSGWVPMRAPCCRHSPPSWPSRWPASPMRRCPSWSGAGVRHSSRCSSG